MGANGLLDVIAGRKRVGEVQPQDRFLLPDMAVARVQVIGGLQVVNAAAAQGDSFVRLSKKGPKLSQSAVGNREINAQPFIVSRGIHQGFQQPCGLLAGRGSHQRIIHGDDHASPAFQNAQELARILVVRLRAILLPLQSNVVSASRGRPPVT